MASTYLERTNGTPDSQRKFTVSCWVKRSKLGAFQYFTAFQDNGVGDPRVTINFRDNDKLQYSETNSSGSAIASLQTTRLFRDVNSWYHIVVSVDTTNATADDRIKIYVNGEQETSFSTRTNYSQNTDTVVNDNRHLIGALYNNTLSSYFDGCLAHYHYCDGYVYDADDFGETDSTTGEWKAKTDPSVTYGTNGVFLKFENASDFGEDSSGNDNDFTKNGSATQLVDTPSNVFANFNINYRSSATFTNCNTTYTSPSANPVFGSLTTLGISKGKWYAECKYSAGTNHYLILGVADYNFSVLSGLGSATNTDLGKNGTTGSIAYVVNTGAYRVNNSNTSWGDAGGDGDILMMAMDKDNEKLYFGVNGTWGNSSDPAAGTGGIDVSSVLTGDEWFFGVTNDTGSNETVAHFNFGNGYFGTTAVVSSNQDGAGYGVFEYTVPTGYYALCTKNINTYG